MNAMQDAPDTESFNDGPERAVVIMGTPDLAADKRGEGHSGFFISCLQPV